MSKNTTGRFVLRAVRIGLWALAGASGVITLSLLALQIPGVQTYIAQRVVSSISARTHSRIQVGAVSVGFQHTVILRDIVVEDRRGDTLLSVQTVAADVNLLGLFSHALILRNLRLDSLTAHITRSFPDSSYNFDFILQSLRPAATSGAFPDTSAGTPWEIHPGGLSLHGVLATYDDGVSGVNLRLEIGSLESSFDAFDPGRSKIRIDRLALENATARFVLTRTPPRGADVSPHSEEADIGFRALSCANVLLKYEDQVSGERFDVDIGKSNILAERIDLPSHSIGLRMISVENTSVKIIEPERRLNSGDAVAGRGVPWVISLDDLDLSGNSVQYDEGGAGRTGGLDQHHLRLNGLAMHAADLFFSDNRIAANLIHASFRERSGLDVRDCSGRFTLDSLHARITDLTLETSASRIHQDILLTYASLARLKRLGGEVSVVATTGESRIGIPDLLLFEPSLPAKANEEAAIRISSRISGRIGDLKIEDCRIATGRMTTLNLTGSIRGLPDADSAHYDLTLHEFSTGRDDILALVPDSVLTRSMVVPAALNMNGEFKGSAKDFHASADIATSTGNVKGSAELRSGRWNAAVSLRDFDLGSLIGDPVTFGPVSMNATGAGTGLTREDIKAHLDVEVDRAVLNGYPYRRFRLSGDVTPHRFEGKAEIQDSNLVFAIDGSVNTGNVEPAYRFRLDLKGADLKRLRLTQDDVRIAGVITTDLVGQNLNDMNGTVQARNIVILKNRKRYVIDSLQVVSEKKETKTHISIESALLSAAFDGSIAVGDLPAVLREHFGRYFTLHDSPSAKAPDSQAFTFHIDVRNPRMFTEVFVPQIDRLGALDVKGSYDSGKSDLNLEVDVAGLSYGGFEIDSLRLTVSSDPGLLRASARVGSVSDSLVLLTNLEFTANVAHDSIAASLRSTGRNGTTNMLVAGNCIGVPGGYQWRFSPDGMVFQNTAWRVSADNTVRFGGGHFSAHDVTLRGDGQTISMNSADGEAANPPLTIAFAGFDLGTLSRVVERDSGLVRGVLDGNVVLRINPGQTAFTSDLRIRGLALARRAVGDVALRADNERDNVYSVSLDVNGNDNEISAQGEYRSKEGGSELNLQCDLKKVNLAALEPLTFGAVRRLSGNLRGGLNVTGTIREPTITGSLDFSNAAFDPAMLGSYLRVHDGTIVFDGKGVHFGPLEFLDTLGNKASLSGSVFTGNFRTFRYDFHVSATKFLLMNKPAARDALYYGTVILDSDISVSGDDARPVIRMQAHLDKGTDLAFALPESESDVQQRYGIVRFIDVRNPSNAIMSRKDTVTRGTRDTTGRRHSSIDLTANVEVNKESRLRILIDPTAGDSLVIRGEATFSVGVDQSGKMAVTGRYEISDGSYQLSFGQFIRREFAIAKGSSLTWFGSVTDANVDITAVYTVKTSALDLVQDQLVGLSQEERNKYKQAVRIQVYLMMEGKLLAPNIHFRLDLPPDGRGILGGAIYAKLNEINTQESELNKQVFALLVLGRFVSSNPLASAAEGGFSSLARSSVSQILTEQLNRLSEKVIPGVGLSVGIESYQDYSTGSAEGRTQLQLALSKQLFDERVTVQVGGNADLEGQRSQQNALNNFAGDIKVAYKMTEDGRWVLQVFRQNTNAGAIEGDLVETGVGLVFTIDYDKLTGVTLTPVSLRTEAR